jgi:hypothetical protein
MATAEALRTTQRHTELLQRDHIMGIEAQLASALAEQDRLRGRVNHYRALAKSRADRVDSLKSSLAAARSSADERARAIADMRASLTWRIGRVFVRPLSLFKRSGK